MCRRGLSHDASPPARWAFIAGENGALGPSNATAASGAFVASRMDDFKAYGSATIAVWVINPVRGNGTRLLCCDNV